MIVPSATTRLAAVIGNPVRHSLSPTLHNAAFAALGLDWTYLAFEVEEGSAARALEAMRVLGIEGLSVTMPHKAGVAAAVDRLSPVAARLGAVNCVRRDPSDDPRKNLLIGENTDGEGFLRSLAEEAGFDPAGRRCMVLGAGGAARAVVLALARAGASEVAVWNRSADRAVTAAALAGDAGRLVEQSAAVSADLIVNATPVGMGDRSNNTIEMPIDPKLLSPGQVVADLIYHPIRTSFLEAAELRGAVTVNGLGMLLHQAGLAFELWTGQTAPIGAMRTAVLDQLASRSSRSAEHKP